MNNRPIRPTQCCTQFKSPGVKILCVLYLQYNVAFTFKWYGNSWNKTVYSQRVWIGYNTEAPCKRIQHCWPTTPNIVGYYMLRPFAHPVSCCWMLLCVVAHSLKPVKLFSQQLPAFLLFHDRRRVAQQCWIRLHSSSNIGATHAHYVWFTKTYGLYPSYDALQVPKLLGVVASVCRPLPTHTQQLPTLLRQ